MGKMHADEIGIDGALVARLVAGRFPEWAGLPVRRVTSPGTVNALYRLGDDLVVRLPLVPWGADGVAEEYELYHRLEPLRARMGAVRIPEPLGLGEPADGYPCPWSVYRWLAGTNPDPDRLVAAPDEAVALGTALGGFAVAVRGLDPDGAPDAYRGGPLTTQDPQTRGAIAELAGLGMVDAETEAALADVWDRAVAAPAWDGPPGWVHGDLMPGNLLVGADGLSAVIDFGTAGVGDPACDLIPAWNLLPAGPARDAFRAGVEVDDATWLRGRARALSMALIQLPYYRDTNRAMADNARHVISAVLADA